MDCFFVVQLFEFLIYSGYESLCRWVACQYLLLCFPLSLCTIGFLLCSIDALGLMLYHFPTFATVLCVRGPIQKSTLMSWIVSCFLLVAPQFQVFHLEFWFILFRRWRRGLLCLGVFPQHHLMNSLSCLRCIFFGTSVENQLLIDTQIHSQGLCYFSRTYVLIFMLVSCFLKL